jgi:sterol 14-demethylase
MCYSIFVFFFKFQVNANPADLPTDFLQMLIDSTYRDNTQLKDEEITGLLLAALFAGQHTSSISSTWMGLRIIDSGAKLIEELRDEQKRVLGQASAHGGALTVEALEDMQLLHASMKETLRLYSPLVLLMRKVWFLKFS